MRKIELSVDDGFTLDPQFANICEKWGFKACFYIPINYEKKTLTDLEIRELEKAGHEIGGHTFNHYILRNLSDKLAWEEIYLGQQILEQILGHKVTKFAYPRGRFNPSIKEMVKRAGFTEARTTRVLNTSLEFDSYEKDTTVQMYPRDEYRNKTPLAIATPLLEKIEKEGGRFHLWAHTIELENYDLWDELQEILKLASQIKWDQK